MTPRITDVLPQFRPGMVLRASDLALIAERINAEEWQKLLDSVRSDARAQVETMAARYGL